MDNFGAARDYVRAGQPADTFPSAGGGGGRDNFQRDNFGELIAKKLIRTEKIPANFGGDFFYSFAR